MKRILFKIVGCIWLVLLITAMTETKAEAIIGGCGASNAKNCNKTCDPGNDQWGCSCEFTDCEWGTCVWTGCDTSCCDEECESGECATP